MALGTNLASDLEAILSTFEAVDMFGDPVVLTAAHYAAWIAAALNSYLSEAVYAADNIGVVSSMFDGDFVLPTEGTAAEAATKGAEGVENYFINATLFAPPGITLPSDPTRIIYTSVKPTIEGNLVTVFSAVNNTAAQQALSISQVIELAISSISTNYILDSGPTLISTPSPIAVL